MKFEFDGREFDTDKPIYVLGYTILKSWFSMKKENIPRVLDSGYKICCKKMRVCGMDFHFSQVTDKNEVLLLRLLSLNYRNEVKCDYDRNICIIGHSVAECQKIFEEWRSSV